MDVSSQFRQLANLLRVSASTARDLASISRFDVGEIDRIASDVESIAGRLDRVAAAQLASSEPDWMTMPDRIEGSC